MTMVPVDFQKFVRPGDTVLWGQGSGEPRTLTEALVEQRARLRQVRVFLGAAFSDTLKPEHADHLRFFGIGGIGRNAELARAGVLDVLPCHISSVPALIEERRLPVDVVLVQVSPPGPDGRHSLGLVADYLPAAMTRARTVIAEVNDEVPYTLGDTLVEPTWQYAVRTSRPPVFVPPRQLNAVEIQIGELVAGVIPDGGVIQLGVGGVPNAIAHALHDKCDLGIHAGSLGDWAVDLMTSGVVTNARKPIDRGVTIAGALYGTRRLYDFVHNNPAVQLRPISYTHSATVLAQLKNLVAVNSAVQVDLTGQVNAETVGGSHIGTVGGQVDFVRAALASPGGRSVIALPSTAMRGTVSRLVPRLSDGITTTARSDADLVVTEHGIADLRGATLRERAERLIEIASPGFREKLRSWVDSTPRLC